MSNKRSKFEILPNEIFIGIFEYLDARDLYRAFYNLNLRFNILLESCNNLILSLTKDDFNNYNEYEICFPYLKTLILDFEVDIYLNLFKNIRRLKLISPNYEQFDELQSVDLPYLEHLSIGSNCSFSYSHNSNYERKLCDKIFSNSFPYLKTCILHMDNINFSLSYDNQLIQLEVLKIQLINFSIYQNILSICPNLHLFQFSPQSYKQSVLPNQHTNLKKMIMIFYNVSKPFYDQDIQSYLASVPNLEELIIHGSNDNANIQEYFSYNWLSTSINNHLFSLRQLKYYFHIYLAQHLIDNRKLLNHLEDNFKYEHRNRYESKLVFKLYPWSMLDTCL